MTTRHRRVYGRPRTESLDSSRAKTRTGRFGSGASSVLIEPHAIDEEPFEPWFGLDRSGWCAGSAPLNRRGRTPSAGLPLNPKPKRVPSFNVGQRRTQGGRGASSGLLRLRANRSHHVHREGSGPGRGPGSRRRLRARLPGGGRRRLVLLERRLVPRCHAPRRPMRTARQGLRRGRLSFGQSLCARRDAHEVR